MKAKADKQVFRGFGVGKPDLESRMYRRRVATIPGERFNVADVPAGVLGRRDAAVELRDEIVEIGARPGLRRVVCSKEQEHRGVIHCPTLELGSSRVSAVALLERSRRPVADLAANQPDDAAEVPLRRREGGPIPSDQRYRSSVVDDEAFRRAPGVGNHGLGGRWRRHRVGQRKDLRREAKATSIALQAAQRRVEIGRYPVFVYAAREVGHFCAGIVHSAENLAGPSCYACVLRERAEVPLAGVGEQNPRRLIIISSVERYGQTTESLKCMGLSALECGRSVYLEYAGAFGIEESEDAVPPGCCHAQREFLEPSALGKALRNAPHVHVHVHVPPPLHAWRWHS